MGSPPRRTCVAVDVKRNGIARIHIDDARHHDVFHVIRAAGEKSVQQIAAVMPQFQVKGGARGKQLLEMHVIPARDRRLKIITVVRDAGSGSGGYRLQTGQFPAGGTNEIGQARMPVVACGNLGRTCADLAFRAQVGVGRIAVRGQGARIDMGCVMGVGGRGKGRGQFPAQLGGIVGRRCVGRIRSAVRAGGMGCIRGTVRRGGVRGRRSCGGMVRMLHLFGIGRAVQRHARSEHLQSRPDIRRHLEPQRVLVGEEGTEGGGTA